jgi:hypothetical protein
MGCRQSQQFGSGIPVRVDEGEVEAAGRGVALEFTAQRFRAFGSHEAAGVDIGNANEGSARGRDRDIN